MMSEEKMEYRHLHLVFEHTSSSIAYLLIGFAVGFQCF